MALNRVKLLTSNTYSPTNPASESDIRSQIDGSIQEIADLLALTTDGASGADGVGATVIPALGAANTVQSQMEASVAYFKALADGFVMGAIPDNSIEDKKLKETVYAPIPVAIGNNTVTVANKTDVIPRIDFTPISYVNDFGKVGNCEATTGFTVSGCTIALDTVNKVFGVNCIAITLTATTGTVTIPLPSVFDVSAYHLFSAYLKKGTATNIKLEKDATGGGVSKSVTSTDSTMTRNAFKSIPSDNNAGNLLKITVTGSIGNVAYIDGFMSNAITLAENSDSEAVLMARYPYGDSMVPTVNPIVDIAHADGSKTQTTLEGRFYSGDALSLEAGQPKGSKLWKERTLYGKDNNILFSGDNAGYKIVKFANFTGVLTGAQGHNITKYDGKILKEVTGINAAEQFLIYTDGFTYISVADTDTGWAESINPNDDEIKAERNGWKALNNNGTRYDLWVNKLGSLFNKADFPAPTSATLSTAATTAAGNTIDVESTAGWVNGDLLTIINYVNGANVNVTSATRLTLVSGTWGQVIPSGAVVARRSTATVDYCKSNVAPNYEGDKLIYKLATPQTIGQKSDDFLVPLKGDTPVLEPGVNTVAYDTGIVRGEVIKAVSNGVNFYTNINSLAYPPVSGTEFKNKVESIQTIYKDGVPDPSWVNSVDANAWGGKIAAYCPPSSYDPNATYTADYTSLRTIAPQISSAVMSFKEGITDAINRIADALNTKQNQNVTLDNLVDASMYEKISPTFHPTVWFTGGGALYVRFFVSCLPKNVVPRVKKDTLIILKGYLDATIAFTFENYTYSNGQLSVLYKTVDTTTINDVKANGAMVYAGYTLDCREVV